MSKRGRLVVATLAFLALVMIISGVLGSFAGYDLPSGEVSYGWGGAWRCALTVGGLCVAALALVAPMFAVLTWVSKGR